MAYGAAEGFINDEKDLYDKAFLRKKQSFWV